MFGRYYVECGTSERVHESAGRLAKLVVLASAEDRGIRVDPRKHSRSVARVCRQRSRAPPQLMPRRASERTCRKGVCLIGVFARRAALPEGRAQRSNVGEPRPTRILAHAHGQVVWLTPPHATDQS